MSKPGESALVCVIDQSINLLTTSAYCIHRQLLPQSIASAMQPIQRSGSVGCSSSCWVVPPPTPAPVRSSSEPPTPAPEATDNDKPSTALPMPPPLFRLVKRRLPFLVASAAGALLGGASSGGGLLPLLQQPYPSPLAVTAAHATTPPTPLPLPLLVAGVVADSPAKPAVLLLPIGKIEAQIDEVGGLLKVRVLLTYFKMHGWMDWLAGKGISWKHTGLFKDLCVQTQRKAHSYPNETERWMSHKHTHAGP